MPLRYLDSKEPQYVPSYTPLQPQIIAQGMKTAGEQSQRGLEYGQSQLQLVGENVAALEGLSEKDRESARQRFEQTEQNLQKIYEQQGARGAMPFIDREVRDITEGLRFHQQASNIATEVSEKLEGADELPAPVAQYVGNKQPKVKYNEFGDPIGVESAFNMSDVEVASRWKDIHKELQSFNQDWKANRIESPGLEVSAERTVLQRRALKQLGFTEVSEAGINHLLSDPQIAAQLDLIARMELDQRFEKDEQGNYITEGKNFTIIQEDDGTRKIKTKSAVPKTDNNGNLVRDSSTGEVEYETIDTTYNSFAEWKAAQQMASYAQRESFVDLSFQDTREFKGSGESVEELSEGLNFFLQGEEVPTTTFQEWKPSWEKEQQRWTSTVNETKSYAKNRLSEEFGIPQERLGIDVKNGQVRMFQIDENGNQKDITLDQIPEYARPQMQDYTETMRNADSQKRKMKREFKTLLTATHNQVFDNLGEKAKNLREDISITDQGTLNISQEGFNKLIDTGEIENLRGELSATMGRAPISPDSPLAEISNIISRGLSPGEVIKTEIQRDYGTEEIAVFEQDGEIKYVSIDNHPILSKIEKSVTNQLNKNTNELVDSGIREYPMYALDTNNDQHKNLIKQYEDRSIAGLTGEIRNIATDEIIEPEDGVFMTPSGFTYIDGEPAVVGIIEKEGENPIYVHHKGTFAESIAQNLDTGSFRRRMLDAQIRSIVPNLLGQTGSTNINQTQMKHMGLVDNQKNPVFNNIEIRKSKKLTDRFSEDRTFYSDQYTAVVEEKDGSIKKVVSDNLYDLTDKILFLNQ